MMTAISKGALEILNHAVGITEWNRTPNRGYFNVGESRGCDYERCTELEAAGYMTRRDMGALGGLTFFATPSGKEFAVDQLPPLPPPKVMTRAQRTWDEFMDADYGHSFSEWLCIELPKVERSRPYHEAYEGSPPNGYRLVRREHVRGGWRPEVKGQWKATMKEAKASYKAALKAARKTTG